VVPAAVEAEAGKSSAHSLSRAFPVANTAAASADRARDPTGVLFFANPILRKSRPQAALNSILIMDQTNLNAGLDLRRYAMKAMPAKPRIIIAQVEGSGTASVMSASAITLCANAVG
jgi:hypothetical protein